LQAIKKQLGGQFFEELDCYLQKYCKVELIDQVAVGGNGSIYKGTFVSSSSGSPDLVTVVLKLELESLGNGLSTEIALYSKNESQHRVRDSPFPKVHRVFSKRADNFHASVTFGSEKVNLMCLEFLDIETTQRIWTDARIKLKEELEVTSSLRYLIVDVLHALLSLVQGGVGHGDFKVPHHVGFRYNDGGYGPAVLFDFGMAVTSTSFDSEMRSRSGKGAGTRGYRAPLKRDSLALWQYSDMWALAASIVKLFVPKLKSDEFENRLHEVVRKKNFGEFLQFALGERNASQMKNSCLRLLELAYFLFQSTPFDNDNQRPLPLQALTSALVSDFALCFIFENQSIELKLRNEGIVIDGRTHKNGKIQRPVLLISDDQFGLMVLTIFKSKRNDPAVDYVGRVRVVSDRVCRESFSMHAVGIGPGEILDGAPCKDLPLETLIKAKGMGSMLMSSRSNPDISRSGNVSLLDRLSTSPRTDLLVDGLKLDSISMFYREDVMECTVASWDYQFGNGSHGIKISEDKINAAMAVNSPSHIAAYKIAGAIG